jgi:hypothetical protein
MINKPDCYKCKWRESLTWDAHSKCKHPKIDEGDAIISTLAMSQGRRSSAMKRLNVSGDDYGIKSGWFYWPLNYDPIWLLTCEGFEPKGGETGEAKME